MKYLRFAFVVVIASGCIQCRETKTQVQMDEIIESKKEEDYLVTIKNLGLEEIYRECKWRVYCYSCDDTVLWRKNLKMDTLLTISSLDIKLSGFKNTNDSVIFSFCYAFEAKQLSCDSFPIDNTCILTEIGVEKINDSILYYKTNCNFLYSSNDPSSRFTNP